jgi:hypothetical protein
MTMYWLYGIVHANITEEQRRPLLDHFDIWVVFVDIHMCIINPYVEWAVKIHVRQ